MDCRTFQGLFFLLVFRINGWLLYRFTGLVVPFLARLLGRQAFRRLVGQGVRLFALLSNVLTSTPFVVISTVRFVTRVLNASQVRNAKSELLRLQLAFTVDALRNAGATVQGNVSVTRIFRILVTNGRAVLAVRSAHCRVTFGVHVDRTLLISSDLDEDQRVVPGRVRHVLCLRSFVRNGEDSHVTFSTTLPLTNVGITARFFNSSVE